MKKVLILFYIFAMSNLSKGLPNHNVILNTGLEFLNLVNNINDKVGSFDDQIASFANVAKNFGAIGGIVSLAVDFFLPKADPLAEVYSGLNQVNSKLNEIDSKIDQLTDSVKNGFDRINDKLQLYNDLSKSRSKVDTIYSTKLNPIRVFLSVYNKEEFIPLDQHRNHLMKDCKHINHFIVHLKVLLELASASVTRSMFGYYDLFYHLLSITNYSDFSLMLYYQDIIFKYAFKLSLTSQLCDAALQLDSKSKDNNFQILSSYLIKITDAMKNHVKQIDSMNNAHFIGCYRDKWYDRDFHSFPWTLTSHLTHRKCIDYCTNLGFKYAAVQDGHLCFCGSNDVRKHGSASLSECNKPCKGSMDLDIAVCGGHDRNAVFQTKLTETTNGLFIGYYSKPNDHFFSFNLIRENNKIKIGKIDQCVRHCENLYFAHAILTEGDTCFCDNFDKLVIEGFQNRQPFLNNYIPSTIENLSFMRCPENDLMFCGGKNHYSIYKTNSPYRERVENAAFVGCLKDAGDRDLNWRFFYGIPDLTISKCIKLCKMSNAHYAGVQFGEECFCGRDSAGKHGPSDKCNMPCSGDRNEICGGPAANSVYSLVDGGGNPKGTRVGCFRDRGVRDFAEAKFDDHTNSHENCFDHCSSKGFTYAALQGRRDCWCGNYYGKYGPATNCHMHCTGNKGQTCGGSFANEVFSIVPKLNHKFVSFNSQRDSRDTGKWIIVGGGRRDYWMKCSPGKRCISINDRKDATKFELDQIKKQVFSNGYKSTTLMFRLFGTNFCLTTWDWRMDLKECNYGSRDQQWNWSNKGFISFHVSSPDNINVWYDGLNREIKNVKLCSAWQCIWNYERA